MQALQILAGPRARSHLRERGLQPADVGVVPAAAGGPKGLALNALDRFICGHWLSGAVRPVHLMGASIGAWRMAAACLPDADAALRDLAEDYITQDYPRLPGKAPKARDLSRVFGATIEARLGSRAAQILAHRRFRLHVITSRGRHLMRRERRIVTPLGYLGAFAANAVSRRAMGGWLARGMFSDPREPLPFALHDYRTHPVALDAANLAPSVLASCSIPVLARRRARHPRRAAWRLLGWLHHRLPPPPGLRPDARVPGAVSALPSHRGAGLARQDAQAPPCRDGAPVQRGAAGARPAVGTRRVPHAKLPDHGDFKAYGERSAERQRDWRRAVAECQRPADEFALVVERDSIEAQPLP